METRRIGNEEVIKQLPSSLQKLMAFERFYLHNVQLFQNAGSDVAFDTGYLPQNCGAFKLPCFWVPKKHLYVYGSQTQEIDELTLLEGSGLHERALFPIHPMSLRHYGTFLSSVGAKDAAEEGFCIWAVPTSSTRTLLVWPDGAPERALFVKTSLHSLVLGDRRLYIKKVGCSVGLSRLVQDSQESLPGELGYFPESMGLVPRRMQDSGVIIRSIPKEIKDDRFVVAPLFSLLGGSGDHSPLFLQILEQSGAQPRQFLEEVLCRQFARLWLEMSMCFGLILEAHGQDLMLALSPNLSSIGRFFYRDFEGLQVDWELRRRRGLPEPDHMPHAWAWHETYSTWGYRYGNLVSYKLMISLYQYLHLVLNELDRLLREWQDRGFIGGRRFESDDVTMIFSCHMIKAIDEMFGVRMGAEYNIYRSLKKFVIFLMKLREELAASGAVAVPKSAGGGFA